MFGFVSLIFSIICEFFDMYVPKGDKRTKYDVYGVNADDSLHQLWRDVEAGKCTYTSHPTYRNSMYENRNRK